VLASLLYRDSVLEEARSLRVRFIINMETENRRYGRICTLKSCGNENWEGANGREESFSSSSSADFGLQPALLAFVLLPLLASREKPGRWHSSSMSDVDSMLRSVNSMLTSDILRGLKSRFLHKQTRNKLQGDAEGVKMAEFVEVMLPTARRFRPGATDSKDTLSLQRLMFTFAPQSRPYGEGISILAYFTVRSHSRG